MRKLLAIFIAAAALLSAQKPLTFEAASIRPLPSPDGPFHYNIYPNRLDAANIDLKFLICDAFNLPFFQVSGPNTAGPHHFDIAATTSAPVSRADMRLMLQSLLIERFHLATHWETKTESVLRLEVMTGGPKMQAVEAGYASPNSPMGNGSGGLRFTGPMSMRQLAESITRFGGKAVIDATNLEGYFKIDLTFAPESPDLSAGISSAPLLADAVQEQLGLKLTPAKEAVKILVVDHADDVPTEN